MTAQFRCLLAACACLLVLTGLAAAPAHAHPADELCTPDGGMDPALCRELARLDSKTAQPAAPTPAAEEPEDDSEFDRSAPATAAFYVGIGFQHILPKGVDHILFVLALFLSSQRVRPLLFQISAFTIAHTATLGLAASGVITPMPSLAEPLIALTIAWAALENIIFADTQAWRPLLAFGFGLVHGMGFAGAFSDLGLPQGVFWPALIGFNIGVEFGQLAVIGMAIAAAVYFKGVLRQAGQMQLYRPLLVWPVSATIGAIGLWWAIERAFFQG
ncbi:HupE/UreJ family protein [Hyphomonas johnsonii]|uniref:HupE/UreJ family protein n=1 Tax=Hyphomonas johnsonii MHS-2 TaxID=1280950 RepID=A0A059FHS6_9PROT|nr:HupE/UreJ family protein [Hyphomonas johnsonii]KCZ90071.1 hypothetical protein HJO_14016 [Hyphomonas johnsonii MHS-2]